MIIAINSADDMMAFGTKLASCVPSGGMCVNLVGDIGAGKTTFAKGFALGLGIADTIQSPTFTISRVYTVVDGRTMVHYDFYRLGEPGIMAEELRENLDGQAIVLIEWGDIVASLIPNDSLTLTINSTGNDERTVSVKASGDRSRRMIEEYSNASAH